MKIRSCVFAIIIFFSPNVASYLLLAILPSIAHPIRRICAVMSAQVSRHQAQYFLLSLFRGCMWCSAFFIPSCLVFVAIPPNACYAFLELRLGDSLAPGAFSLQTAKGRSSQQTTYLVFLAKIWTSGHALRALVNNLRGIKAYFLPQEHQMLRDAPPYSGQV